MFSFAVMNTDEVFMQHCLELAFKGMGSVKSNPMVGAVLVYEGKIIGEGYHKKFGDVHAEVNAIHSVPKEFDKFISSSILYVNLEPCSHYGKTPPCANLIIDKKIRKVVIGCLDPNPLVHGSGVKKLVEAGIEVVIGILENECIELNKYFICFHKNKRPYITLKWAQSLDGFIANEDYTSVHLTNRYCDQMVHKMRAEHMAIFAGGRTVISDNPKLNIRYWNGHQPIRVSFDTKNNFQKEFHIFSDEGEVIIFNYDIENSIKNVKYIKISKGGNYVEQVINHLFELNIVSILVEGGTQTIQYFLESGYWDAAKVFISEYNLDAGIPAPTLPDEIICKEKIFNNTIITSLHI